MCPGLQKISAIHRSAATGVVLALILFGAGCGKKAMPRPPAMTAVNLPIQLNFTVKENRLNLNWVLDDAEKRNIKGFVIYQADHDLGAKPCDGCPLVFKPVAEIGPEKRSMTIFMARAGMAYFEIRALGPLGMESSPSNRIKVRMP